MSHGQSAFFKLGVPISDLEPFEDREHVHARVYEILNPDSKRVKLFAGVPHGDAYVFEQLVKCLKPPYLLLYILHTPRGTGEPGRYQSPELATAEFSAFVDDFREFLAADGRFDIWAYSPEEHATVAWDRHNHVYGYGPLERFVEVLGAIGFQPGSVDRVKSGSHTHHYRSEFDEQARAMLDRFDWRHSDLREEDEQ